MIILSYDVFVCFKRTIATEFERLFQNLITDKDETESKLRQEIIDLTKERDHLQEDVMGVEKAFDDLHRRFEKLKLKIEEFKKVFKFLHFLKFCF